MIELQKENEPTLERAILVGIRTPDEEVVVAAEYLDELADLVDNLNIGIVDRVHVNLRNPQPKYLTGSGKAIEIAEKCNELEADCLIFDTPLTPTQQRNWEKLAKCRVIDREEVILEIFHLRASTREAVLQVELVRLQYMLPRLTGAWGDLAQQRGGITGGRGSGEKLLETDRRVIRDRIASIEKELKVVQSRRVTERKRREQSAIPHAAIVGYTNVGKSSLLKVLSGSDILVADRLFATLDPMTRRMILDDNQELLLTDTVGFVRNLPHTLVEAFKSTLEVAVLADFLILMLDISSPYIEEQWETTLSVLRELGADDKNIIVVFNKVDKIDRENDVILMARTRMLFPDSVYISTVTGEGLDNLKQRMSEFASSRRKLVHIELPPTRHDLVALAHESGNVLEEDYDNSGNIKMTFTIGPDLKHQFEDYIITE